MRSDGCPLCAKLKEKIKHNRCLSKDEFIKRANIIHNFEYDYSNIEYVNQTTPIIIVCKIHGEFSLTPSLHSSIKSHKGCQKCGTERGIKKNTFTTEEFVQRASVVHKNKYNYEKFIYKNTDTAGIITCPIHGDFEQIAMSHLYKKCGCPKCAIEKNKKILRSDTETFVIRANEVHQFEYDYSQSVYINNSTKVAIFCSFKNTKKEIHGIFWQVPAAHLQGQGCPKCISRISEVEKLWLDRIGLPDDPKHRQVSLPGLRIQVDGFDPITNTCYELLGDFWHGNDQYFPHDQMNNKINISFGELFRKTVEKEKKILDAGYFLVSVWESEIVPDRFTGKINYDKLSED